MGRTGVVVGNGRRRVSVVIPQSVAKVMVSYSELKKARKRYEEDILAARDEGITFSRLAYHIGLSEPAVRMFIRRAQARREREQA